MRHSCLSIIVAAAVLTGCARTPPVSVNYYLTRSALHARVIRTVACDASNTPVIANTVTTEVLHSADPDKIRTTDLSKIDSAFANSELKAEFYGDGRLKGINATTVGQGETIIKAAIKLAQFAGEAPPRASIEEACKAFRIAFADKTLTLILDIRDALTPGRDLIPILPEPTSADQFQKYQMIAGDTCLRFGRAFTPTQGPAVHPSGSDLVIVKARQPGLLETAITAGPSGDCTAGVLWSGVIQVGQLGKEYEIPIPKAALFGKQVFAVAFDDSGALTSLSYNKDSGAASLLNTVQAAGEALQTTDAERLAALKGEADIIAAQQRLVRCQTSPKTCQ